MSCCCVFSISKYLQWRPFTTSRQCFLQSVPTAFVRFSPRFSLITKIPPQQTLYICKKKFSFASHFYSNMEKTLQNSFYLDLPFLPFFTTGPDRVFFPLSWDFPLDVCGITGVQQMFWKVSQMHIGHFRNMLIIMSPISWSKNTHFLVCKFVTKQLFTKVCVCSILLYTSWEYIFVFVKIKCNRVAHFIC